MLKKLWTEIRGYCLFGEGGPGKKTHLRFTKGSKILEKYVFFISWVFLRGSGWSKFDSGEVFGIFGGVNLSRGDAAVLYGGSKNWFGATGGQFLNFWPTVFTIIFCVDGIFSKFLVFGTDFSRNGSPWEQIGFWSMKMDIVGFGKFGFDGRFGWKCRFWRNRGPKKPDFSADFLANFWWFSWGEP